LSSEYK